MTAKPRKPGHVLLVALCVGMAGVSGSGCSFIFVDGPPTQHKRMPYFDCTTSNVLPVIDVIVAVAEGASGVSELVTTDQYSTSSSRAAAVTAIGVGALFAASGINGFSKTTSCREAKELLVERASHQPGGYGAPGFAPTSPPPGYGAPGPMPAPYDPWLGPPAAVAPPDSPPPGAPATPAPGAAPAPRQPSTPTVDGEAPPTP